MKHVFISFVFTLYGLFLLALPMQSALETTGIAPCAIYFDATNTASGIIQPNLINDRKEYADFYYTWDFGDPNSGNWPLTQTPRNKDIGYVACHVYQTPGQYTVSLNVKDHNGVNHQYTQEITILDPNIIFSGNNTICVSSSGDFTGAPVGSLQIQTQQISDIGNYLISGKRVLLRRGDNWSSATNILKSNIQGPVHLGAFGEPTNIDEYGIADNNPIIQYSGSDPFLYLMNIKNWSIYDLHFIGTNRSNSAIETGRFGVENILQYQLEFEEFGTSTYMVHWDCDGANKRWALVNSKAYHNGGMIVYTGAEHLAVMGNLIYESDDTHALRVFQSYKGVISHNYCHGSSFHSSSGRHALKFHGPSESIINSTGGDQLNQRSQYTIVYDNIFGTCGPWPVMIAPQDNWQDERLSDIQFEGNKILSDFGTGSDSSSPVQISLHVIGDHITVKNNIFDGKGSINGYTGIEVSGTSFKNSYSNRIFHNSFYKNDFHSNSESNFTGISIKANANDTQVFNNLVMHPFENITFEYSVHDLGANSNISQNLLTHEPVYINPDHNQPLSRDYHLIAQSPAVDQGITLPVAHDFALNARPSGQSFDIGAFEYQQGESTLPVILSAFDAVLWQNQYVKILWQTESEANLLGFHIYRNTSSDLSHAVRISPVIIEASNSHITQSYTFIDQETEENMSYYYWLKIIENNSSQEYYGPSMIQITSFPENPNPVILTQLKSISPNPFKEECKIYFDLQEEGAVRFDIYNIKGKKVKSLYQSNLNKGNHQIIWRGEDQNNHQLPSGIYFCIMKSLYYQKAQKILYLRD